MGYQNAKDVLPPELLRLLQRYAEGECLYIPRQERAGKRQISHSLAARNRLIWQEYASGTSVQALAERFFLSPQAIYKILSKFR